MIKVSAVFYLTITIALTGQSIFDRLRF